MDTSTEEYDYLSDSDLDEDESTLSEDDSASDSGSETESPAPETDAILSRHFSTLLSLFRPDYWKTQQPKDDATAERVGRSTGMEIPIPDTGRQGKVIIVPDVAYTTCVNIHHVLLSDQLI